MRLYAAGALLGLCFTTSSATFASAPTAERPTEAELREAVRRLLGAKQDLNRCSIVERAQSYRIECRHTECRSCSVTHVITTLIRRSGKWSIAETRRERRGDTGECGCCM